ncbi:DUF4426 domain-containing protein [Pseudoalteromonas byunsanensis]|uniref:DUF4426 domain-containing protein n=1 Tax=Pseudoalteromonas byunsanensis TaxID=327939 RepID=A0A1S1N226_9GAMM|nr:DUF4426 domain-containing protein [Pseudoalteromonas byunsanensis]OHU95246.1 hypothetical protein BIW53_11010 [Pseudoalteromonas byunsanensis]
MKKYLSLALLLFVCAFANASSEQGGQFKNLGPWQVHYIAFPSTFIQPTIAKAYDIDRSNYKAVVNISVLKNNAEKTAQKATLTGEARNLIGTKQDLEFKEVIDGDAIYYLAQIAFNNEETYRFTINIAQGNNRQVLKFQQKFYVD